MNKSTKILVGFSLAANVLLIGVILGHLSNSRHGHWGTKHSHYHCHKAKHWEKYSNDKFAKLHEKQHEMFKQVEAKREELFKVLTAEKFDPVAYEQKSKELHQEYAQIAETMSATIKDTAIGLSQADRLELANELRYFKHKKHK